MLEKNYLIQLTSNLYRLTLLFPKKDPLKYKMRGLGDDILANLILISENPQPYSTLASLGEGFSSMGLAWQINDAKRKLEVLNGFFELARVQNWVSNSEILSLQEEYSKLKDELSQQMSLGVQPQEMIGEEIPRAEGERIYPVNERHKRILEILKDRGKAQVWEVKKVFPDVSKRTLRRDFEHLLGEGLIERIGERNETFYQLKGVGHTYIM